MLGFVLGFAQELLDAVGDEESFVFAVGGLVEADEGAALALGPEFFALAAEVVGNHGAGGGEDVLRGAVVLLQADDAGVGEVLLELEDVADFGAAPGVDALVLVADGAYVFLFAGEELHELVLGTVGVLVLVDEEVAVAALVAAADFLGDVEQADGFEEQVVEVESVVFAQLGAVGLKDVGDALGVGVFGAEVVLLGIDHVVFGPGDAAEDGARGELFGVEAHALHHLLDDGLLVVFVVDGEGAGEAFFPHAQGLDVAAQDADAEGVEGGDEGFGEGGVADEAVDALGHFRGGLVGEGDGEDGVGGNAFFADQPGDAAGDDAGFAGAGAGQDEQRAVGGFDGGALFGIQIGEERRQRATSGGKGPRTV